MKAEVKAKWLKALRSGEYKQGTRALRYQEDGVKKHCCLGVLCDIAVAEGVIPDPGFPGGDRVGCAFGGAQENSYLPLEVRDWAELERTNPVIPLTDNCTSLAGLNDSGVTFEYIARVIEEKL